MDTSGADIIPRDSCSLSFSFTDTDRFLLADWISADVSDTNTNCASDDRSSANGCSVDGVDRSANRLANDTDAEGLANGSSSDDADYSSADRLADRLSTDETDTSSANRLTNRSLANDADTSAHCLTDRSLANDADTSANRLADRSSMFLST
jgi:hypothetical protein